MPSIICIYHYHNYRWVTGRTMWTQCIVLSGACVWSLDIYFNLSPIYHLYVLFVKISYQARFYLQISYPAILFTMLRGFLNHGSYIIHVLMPGTSKVFTVSAFPVGHARSHRSAGHIMIFCFDHFEERTYKKCSQSNLLSNRNLKRHFGRQKIPRNSWKFRDISIKW